GTLHFGGPNDWTLSGGAVDVGIEIAGFYHFGPYPAVGNSSELSWHMDGAGNFTVSSVIVNAGPANSRFEAGSVGITQCPPFVCQSEPLFLILSPTVVRITADGGSLNIAAPVPEVSSWVMMILGFVGIGYLTYRRRSPRALSVA